LPSITELSITELSEQDMHSLGKFGYTGLKSFKFYILYSMVDAIIFANC